MTDYKSIAAAAISAGLLIPPEPPKPKPVRVITVKQLKQRQIQPSFVALRDKRANHICSRTWCNNPAEYSASLGRYITLCAECARKNREDDARRRNLCKR